MKDGPLTEANRRELNNALLSLNGARLEIEAAKRAGIPMDDAIRVADFYEEQINKIKAEYFKGKP